MKLPNILGLVTIILITNIFFIQSTVLGIIFLLIYFAVFGLLTVAFMQKIFPLHNSRLLQLTVSIFIIISIIGFMGSMFIVLYRFTDVILGLILAAISIGTWVLYKKYGKHYQGNATYYYRRVLQYFNHIHGDFTRLCNVCVKQHKQYLPLYFIALLMVGISILTPFLFRSPNRYSITPWEILPGNFALLLSIIGAGILLIVFFRARQWFLIVIIAFSLVQHLYIPMVYQAPHGLDDWRHIGLMGEIIRTGGREPYMTVPYTQLSTVVHVQIPSSLISPKPSYGAFWAVTLFLHKVLVIDLVTLMTWWHMLFFSFFTPILLYILGKSIGETLSLEQGRARERFALLAAFLPALFYPMQLYGATSLPVGYGLLFFLFFLFIVSEWVRRKEKALLYLLWLSIGLMFFSYVVYFLFALLIGGFLFIHSTTRGFERSALKKLIRIGYFFASLLFIPLISLYASPNAQFDILTTDISHIRDFWIHAIQYIPGFKDGSGLRLQSGNLIWHNMVRVSTDAFPFSQPYFDSLLFFAFIILFVYCLTIIFKKLKDTALSWQASSMQSLVVYLFFVAIGSIYVDRFYFGGIHLLTERIDLIVNTCMILVLASLAYRPLIISKSGSRKQIILATVIIALLSLQLGSTYVSGPRFGRATRNHYKAMVWIYEDMKQAARKDYCVLAEHFPLATLEAASLGEVRNGNFPIEYGYVQDNGQIFVKMFSDPKEMWIQEAAGLAGSTGCYFVIDSRFMAPWSLGAVRTVLDKEVYVVDDVYIWRYDTSDDPSRLQQ